LAYATQVQVSAAPASAPADAPSEPQPKKTMSRAARLSLVAAGLIVLLAVCTFAPAPLPQHFLVLMLSIVVGFYVIGKVHHALHTPLMSVTNAISGIVVVGAIAQLNTPDLVVQILAAIGVLLGAFGGFFGGKISDFLEWVYNVFESIPNILLIFAFAAVVGRGVGSVVIILALTGWTGMYRQVRAEFIKHRSREYVRSAEAIGASLPTVRKRLRAFLAAARGALAEAFPDAKLWPEDPALRALGRAAASEMHAGFRALRVECPMDLARGPAPTELSEDALADIARVRGLWSDLLGRSGGPFLLGDWSIADAFFAPVATRFRTYAIEAGSPDLVDYMDRLLNWPDFLEWEAAGRLET
jgi:hypothetical protein